MVRSHLHAILVALMMSPPVGKTSKGFIRVNVETCKLVLPAEALDKTGSDT